MAVVSKPAVRNSALTNRNTNYAGKSVKQGDYTVTYNENGYVSGYKKDGGASATAQYQTTHANDSELHQKAYQAAQQGDWDAVGGYINDIAATYGTKYDSPDLTYDMSAANDYMRELQNQFNYDANSYYQKQYDAVYGEGAWDGGTGTGKPVYNEYSQALVDQYNRNNQNGQVNQGVSTIVPGLSPSVGQASNGGIDDMTKYLEDMYASNLEAELSALKNAYESNVAELESQNDKIAEQYRAARNQAAAQNALEVQGMNERALATGLNTGASGQIALAQNMAYQNNLGNLWAQEAQRQAESDRLMAQMLNDYNTQVNQATATINAQKAEALYNEMIRQENARAAASKEAHNDLLAKAELLAAFGDFSGYKELGLTDSEINMMETAYIEQIQREQAAQAAKSAPKVEDYKPPMTFQQMTEEIALGNITPGVVETYEYYHKTPYNDSNNAGAMADNQYNAYLDSIVQTIGKGYANNALGMVDAIWNSLSVNQQNNLNNILLEKFGTQYQP